MKNEGLVTISRVLLNNSSLTVLGLESNLLSDGDEFDVWGEILSYWIKLERLFFNHNFISKQTAIALGRAFATTESLRELNLSHSSIWDEGEAIAEGLVKNTSLLSL